MYPVTARLLVFIHCDQAVTVKWDNSVSSHFCVSNGVKQGGVLSPILFTNYINNLFNVLKSTGPGCNVGNIFADAFGNADDIILLAPLCTQ